MNNTIHTHIHTHTHTHTHTYIYIYILDGFYTSLLWAELSPQISYVEVLILRTSECDCIEYMDFKEVIMMK